MMQEMLHHAGHDIAEKTATVSGSGNVAQFTAERIMQLGGKVLTMSDSGGFIYLPDGLTEEQLEYIKDLKSNRRGRLTEFAKEYGVKHHDGERPWSVKCDLAFPSATQNEVSEADARALVANGCIAVAEGANMPTGPVGISIFIESGVLYAPSKAANAGGVAVSGLEMTQNSMRLQWSREELDRRLRDIMKGIHASCVEYGTADGKVNYSRGANIAGFIKVADAMVAHGVI
jgi:glutamate dehydrogenase (NADP+)